MLRRKPSFKIVPLETISSYPVQSSFVDLTAIVTSSTTGVVQRCTSEPGRRRHELRFKRKERPAVPLLFFSNISHNCLEPELREWVESKGFPVRSVHLVRDLVAGVSPAFAYVGLCEAARTGEAIQRLNGQRLKDRVIRVERDWRDLREVRTA
jgi:hypothetical protein